MGKRSQRNEEKGEIGLGELVNDSKGDLGPTWHGLLTKMAKLLIQETCIFADVGHVQLLWWEWTIKTLIKIGVLQKIKKLENDVK